MLETATEPTIEDYPHEAPEEAGPGQWSCPLNLGPREDDSITGRLLSEVARLRPWSAETRNQRGRTLFGATGATPDQVDDVARALASVAESGQIRTTPANGGEIDWAFSMPLLIRHLADDLRTFYHEAIAAQPGPGAPNHDALTEWIFGGTALGETLQTVAKHLSVDDDDALALLVRGLLIPEGFFKGGSAFASGTFVVGQE
jgi:hypothetical protein